MATMTLRLIIPSLHDLIIWNTLHHFVMVVVAGLVVLYLVYKREVPINLLDFACYKPPNSYRLPKSMFLKAVFLNNMDPNSIAFQIKILEKTGFSEETCIPPSLARVPIKKSLPRTVFSTYYKGEAKLSREGRLAIQLERGVLTTRLQLLNSVWRRTCRGFKGI